MARDRSAKVVDEFSPRCGESCPNCGDNPQKRGECRKPRGDHSEHRCYYCGHTWTGSKKKK